jgi:7,8-dihydropterin-6-yl-methyl-4-(beta-D-ribofuranosyl)aminobenzene 5'-phosphate synthase
MMNAKCLKKDVREVDHVILSHGHWDHSGGLKQILQCRERTDIIAHPGIFEERFSSRRHGKKTTYHPASIPFEREELEQLGAHFHLTKEYYEFGPGKYFSGEIPRPSAWKSADSGLKMKQAEQYVLDPIWDDASVMFDTDNGPVVIFGCAHAGAETILDALAEKSGYTAFYAVIGGLHLMRADEQRVYTVIEAFEKYQVQRVAATHCTGFPAMAQLYNHFNDRFHIVQVGTVFEF